MPIIISICSEKGGVGKTTTTANLAGGLVRKGNRVLVVDLDQQMNVSYALGYIKDGKPTAAELIYNTVIISGVIPVTIITAKKMLQSNSI